MNGITISMSQSRHRMVLTVSLQPADQTLLERVRSRFARYAPNLNVSEVVRIALALASNASPEMVSTAISQTVRVKLGRPMMRGWDDDDPAFDQEVKERQQRFALMEELKSLQMQPERTPTQELRLQEICKVFDMVLVPKGE